MKRHWGHQQTAGVTAWAVLAALTLAPSVASAQDGAIAGTVTDTTSLVLPGVTVEVRSTVAGGLAQTVFTDGTGTFTLTALPPGTYDVTFTLPGFGTVVRGGVAISAGATATLDVEMSVQLAEQVVVVGSRAQPRSATASAVPVDVISTQEFASQGATDLTDTLRTVVPSFNVNTQPISDAASVVRPANLRNLAALELDAKVELIRFLVPLGLMHVEEILDKEVTALAGGRDARKGTLVGGRRHGSTPGTIGLAGQRVPIRVPRIRHVAWSELPLRS